MGERKMLTTKSVRGVVVINTKFEGTFEITNLVLHLPLGKQQQNPNRFVRCCIVDRTLDLSGILLQLSLGTHAFVTSFPLSRFNLSALKKQKS